MENKAIFKVGDKVYDIVSSEYGEVVDIQDRVKVKIHRKGEEFVYYLADGRMWEHEIPRLIFAEQVKDIVIPEARRPFDTKDFLRKIPLSKEKSTFVIGFTSRFVFADIELNAHGCYWSKDNCSKICDTLNRENVGYKDYLQAIKELIKEGVM